jgi:hypothetical protein
MVPRERARLRIACEKTGMEELTRWWSDMALSWAGVINYPPVWNIGLLTVVYTTQLDIGWVGTVFVTKTASVFIQTSTGVLLSRAEFKWRYGVAIDDYLRGRLVDDAARVERAIEHMNSMVVLRPVLLRTASEPVRTDHIYALECQSPDDWIIPAGSMLVDIL